MDCRKPAVLAFGLFLGGVGCTHLDTVQDKNVTPPPGVEVRKEVDKPRRQPQPATLVSFGELHERTANEPDAIPAKLGEMIVERLPAGRLEVMPDVGHFGPMQDPDATIESMLHFAAAT